LVAAALELAVGRILADSLRPPYGFEVSTLSPGYRRVLLVCDWSALFLYYLIATLTIAALVGVGIAALDMRSAVAARRANKRQHPLGMVARAAVATVLTSLAVSMAVTLLWPRNAEASLVFRFIQIAALQTAVLKGWVGVLRKKCDNRGEIGNVVRCCCFLWPQVEKMNTKFINNK